MAELNISEIKQDATDRLSLARKTEELQVLVDRITRLQGRAVEKRHRDAR